MVRGGNGAGTIMHRVTDLAGLLAAATLATVPVGPAAAQSAAGKSPEAAVTTAYAMPGTQVFDMTAKDDGGIYRIFVSVPSGPAPAGGYRVLYVLDGNAHFAGFAGARALQEVGKLPEGQIMVVGLGYPVDQPFDLARRGYDLTPAWTGSMPDLPAGAPLPRTGGQEHLARFLLDQLRPEIARRYPVNAAHQSLFGHSLGGLFALHMLYTRPTAFEAIVAASPSQWWDGQALLAEERAFAGQVTAGHIKGEPSRLLLLTGEQDDTASITWDTGALAQRLAPLSAYGLRTVFAAFPGEGHMSVPYRAITPTLRFVAGKP